MKTLSILAIISIMTATTACAAYKGPSAREHANNTVREALNAKDDQEMALEGFIVNHLRKDKYTFRDKTGSIVIEIDKEDLYNIDIDDKTRVRIIGEVDKDFSETTFDVDFIRIIK